MVRTIVTLSRRQKNAILLLVEVLCVPLAFVAAQAILASGLIPGRIGWHLAVHVAILCLVTWGLALVSGHYRMRLKDYGRPEMMISGVQAAVVALVSAALSQFMRVAPVAGFDIVLGLMLFALWVGSRLLMFELLEWIYTHSTAVTRVLVYGAGRPGMMLASALKRRSDILPVAFLDDNIALRGLSFLGIPVHSLVDIERLLSEQKIDRAILSMSEMPPAKEIAVTRRLARLGLEVQVLPAFAELIGDGDLIASLEGTRALIERETMGRFAGDGLNAYRGEAVMVTGAGGSIGIELCRQILACRPARLILLELNELALYSAENELSQRADGVEIVAVLGSVSDELLLERVMRAHGVSVVLHAAAYKHVPIVENNSRAGVVNNTLGTAVVARVAKTCKVARFVLVSTDKAVRPVNVMGASKRVAEQVVQDLALRSEGTVFSIVRFGNVLGSSGSVVPRFMDQIQRGGPVTLTDPDVRRYFMTIEEAAHLVLVAGSIARGGEVFVLDMGEQLAIGELARRMIQNAGYTLRDAANPGGDIEIVVTGLRPGEKLSEELMINGDIEPTAHPKILRVHEAHPSQIEVASTLRALRDAADAGDDLGLAAALRRAIPENNLPVVAEHEDRQRPPARRDSAPVSIGITGPRTTPVG
jgi:FlaA1/EpsC-like NDP-sugar epimerase